MADNKDHAFDPELIEAYLLDELTDEQAAALESALRNNPQAREQFVQAVEIMSLVREEFRGREEQAQTQSNEPIARDFNKLFAELLVQEERARAAVVQPTTEPVKLAHSKEDRPGLREVAWLLYSFASDPKVWAPMAAAILFAVGVTLAVLMWGSGGSQPIAQQPTTNQPEVQAIVATLTATHNAAWSGPKPDGDLRRGAPLTVGQQLTLTQGFAEITTARGAVAILEAPATIELLNNDNALRLHSGKLFGICETASSKGFIVRTPHMDVTDLGTRFGVEVDQVTGTLAEVFDGEVEVIATNASSQSGQPVKLSRGQSFAIDATGQSVPRNAFAEAAFDRLQSISSGITLAGQVAWSNTTPSVMRRGGWPTNDNLVILPELTGYRLAEDVITDMRKDKALTWPVRQNAATIPAGTVVRTYVLAFNTGSGDQQQASGSVQFEGEIVGVTTAEQSWFGFIQTAQDAADQLYTFERRHEKDLFPEVDLSQNDQPGIADKLSIAEDGRTLNFELSGTGFAELMRVFVREPANQQP